MREATIRQVMIPRARMLTAQNTISRQHLLSLVADSPYSRIPIFEEDVDKILGVIHLRDLLCLEKDEENLSIQKIIHPVPFVPESMSVKEIFSLLQKKRHQVAIVLDEFGGTSGLVTLEDILEQIFGDLKDEFDAETPNFQLLPGNQIWIRGDMLISQVNDLLNINLPEKDFDTIGGMILNEIGYVPIANDEVTISSNKFRVEKMSGRGVAIISYTATKNLIQAINDRFS
jgi:CBS domain containing-hemolysin-like protein